jgi:hypothetical protein
MRFPSIWRPRSNNVRAKGTADAMSSSLSLQASLAGLAPLAAMATIGIVTRQRPAEAAEPETFQPLSIPGTPRTGCFSTNGERADVSTCLHRFGLGASAEGMHSIVVTNQPKTSERPLAADQFLPLLIESRMACFFVAAMRIQLARAVAMTHSLPGT